MKLAKRSKDRRRVTEPPLLRLFFGVETYCVENGITDVKVEGPDETPTVGGAAKKAGYPVEKVLEELQKLIASHEG